MGSPLQADPYVLLTCSHQFSFLYIAHFKTSSSFSYLKVVGYIVSKAFTPNCFLPWPLYLNICLAHHYTLDKQFRHSRKDSHRKNTAKSAKELARHNCKGNDRETWRKKYPRQIHSGVLHMFSFTFQKLPKTTYRNQLDITEDPRQASR